MGSGFLEDAGEKECWRMGLLLVAILEDCVAVCSFSLHG